MTNQVRQQEINDTVWRACDTFRGTIDPSQYKDYILLMLFIKYISDRVKERREELVERFGDDEKMIERRLARERFTVPETSKFDYLYARREDPKIGELITRALDDLEDANGAKLEGVFRNIDFNSDTLGDTEDKRSRLKHLLEDFNNPKLDLRSSRIGNQDIIGNAYEYLIGKFASDAGKKGGEFYTPPEVATLLAKLLEPKPGNTICDPACGSGSLLIKVGKEVGSDNFQLYGQELNGTTWALCKMNMFLHEMDTARIERCNTLKSPALRDGEELLHFDIVVANPPFSLDKWGDEEKVVKDLPFNRFHRGVPPKSKGDYAFISHMVETAVADTGKVGVIVPHGVLFRGGAEGRIRTQLIKENLLKAVIGLPANLFFGTGIPAAILIFDKGKDTSDVLFIDASSEYEDAKRQNFLRDRDIEMIYNTFKTFETVEKYAYRATYEEIAENEFNLNIPRYVDTFEEEEDIDIEAVQHDIDRLEGELAETREMMAKYLKELGYGK